MPWWKTRVLGVVLLCAAGQHESYEETPCPDGFSLEQTTPCSIPILNFRFVFGSFLDSQIRQQFSILAQPENKTVPDLLISR
jgi:hypothetical protein